MEVDLKLDCDGVDWKAVSETLKCVGMAYDKPDATLAAFLETAGLILAPKEQP